MPPTELDPRGDRAVDVFDGAQHPYLIPGAAGKQLGRTIVGNFNNDDWLDTIVMLDDTPIVLSGRSLYLANETPWPSVVSMDTFPNAGPSGQDAIVYTTESGLFISWWDFTTKEFVNQLVDASWANADHLRVTKVDSTSNMNIVGISPSRRALRILGATNAQPPTFTPRTDFVTTTDIQSFIAVEWDGDETPEVALLVDQALEIRSYDGTILKQFQNLPTGGWLATIRQSYLPYDRLTWVTPSVIDPDTGLPVQAVYTLDQFTIDVGINTSGIYVTSIEGCDWDGDGDDDLISGHGFSHDLIVLLNNRTPIDPTAPSFTSQSPAILLPVGPPGMQNTGQEANVVVGDFDNDGDRDVGMAVASSGEFRIGMNEVEVVGGDAPAIRKMRYFVTQGSSTGELKMRFGPPKKVTGPITDLQIVLWRQPGINSPSEAKPVQTDVFEIGHWPAEVTVHVPETGQYFESTYYLEMRFGDHRNDGEPVVYGEASIGGFTLSPLTVISLANVPASGEPSLVIPEGELVFNPGEIGLLGGAYIPNLRVPPNNSGFNYH